MDFELLAKQGRAKLHGGLAEIGYQKLLSLRKESLRDSFRPFDENENRLEYLARVHGVEFVNDAASQTANATWFALESMTKPTIWIASGETSTETLTTLIPLALEKVKILLCLEDSYELFHKVFQGIVPTILPAHSISDAVKKALYFAESEDVVLFSPASMNVKTAEEMGQDLKEALREI